MMIVCLNNLSQKGQTEIAKNFVSPLRWRYLGAHPQMEMLLKQKEFNYMYVFLLIVIV